MKTIFKYPIEITGVQNVGMPVESKIICVQTQMGQPTLWAEVNPDSGMRKRVIEIFGTGHEMDSAPRNYIGTIQAAGGGLVWHVYERITS